MPLLNEQLCRHNNIEILYMGLLPVSMDFKHPFFKGWFPSFSAVKLSHDVNVQIFLMYHGIIPSFKGDSQAIKTRSKAKS